MDALNLQSIIDALVPDVNRVCGWPNLTGPAPQRPVAVDLTGRPPLRARYQG